MSSGGGSPSNTTSTTELPDWAQPYAQQILQRSSDLSNTTPPQYTGQTVAGLSDAQNQGIAGTTAAANAQSGTAASAQNYVNGAQANPNGLAITNPYSGDVTASQAAAQFADPNGNPALQSQIAQGAQGITNQYSNVTAPTTLAQFRNGGAFGGSAQDEATSSQEYNLGQALASNSSNLENNAYNTAATVASQNAAQANQVAEGNQSVGTNANAAYNSQASTNYQNQQSNILNGIGAATGANTASGALAGQQISAGGVQQQNSQDALNALYQQWYNQVNAPYQQISTLSSGLSGALGSGVGTSVTQQNPGSGNTLASILGLGTAGVGAYNAFNS